MSCPDGGDLQRSAAVWRMHRLESSADEESMNMEALPARDSSEAFLNLVDFKWLMAGMGWWVDLSRLQRDRAYSDECLQRALSSGSEFLRGHSMELLGLRWCADEYSATARCSDQQAASVWSRREATQC